MILKEPPQVKQQSLDNFLFNDESLQQFENAIHESFLLIQNFLANRKFYKGDDITSLEKAKEQAKLTSVSGKNNFTSVLKELDELYIQNAIAFHNTNYIAHLNCPITIPSIVAELVATSINTAIETWDQSTTATFIEQEVINWICRAFNWQQDSDGIFTSGGTQSNFMALLLARDNYAYKHFGINIKQHGWSPELNKFKIFCSEKSHFSIKKNAALLGMGYDAVIPVKVNKAMEMDTEALLLAIEKTKQEGNIPIAVVATLGTTDYGSFDPLKDIISISKEENMWCHVDGAYGGCYVLTETHKKYFEGVEKADSITIDFHKSLFQPVSCSAFLVNNKEHFKYVSYYADYLNPIENKDEKRPNLIEKSIQTTRRFDALKVWLTLKTMGENTIVTYLEKVHSTIREVYDVLKDNKHFEIAHTPALSTLVFRYKNPDIDNDGVLNEINLQIKDSLFKQGKASVASTKLNGNIYLKFTLLNPKNTTNNILKIVDLIQETAQQFEPKLETL